MRPLDKIIRWIREGFVKMNGSKSAWLGLLAILAFPGVAPGGFGAGNLVVVRVGDGSKPFEKGSAAPVFLDEVDLVTGSTVGSVALPTESTPGQRRLTLSMTATSEGQLTTEGLPRGSG
jgi:hypothetical protein